MTVTRQYAVWTYDGIHPIRLGFTLATSLANARSAMRTKYGQLVQVKPLRDVLKGTRHEYLNAGRIES